jgi:hypothetical protein
MKKSQGGRFYNMRGTSPNIGVASVYERLGRFYGWFCPKTTGS